MNNTLNFYEKIYHFDEDISVGIDEQRLKNFFKYINFNEVSRCLDIGCGVGWALEYIYINYVINGLLVGLDFSKKAIFLARKKLPLNINLLVADGERLPFPNNYFDLVFSLGSIEHFQSPRQGLSEINRVTKKNGQILLAVPNSYWLLSKLGIYKGTEQLREMIATMDEWGRLFKTQGLSIKKIVKDIGPEIFKNKNIIGIIKRLLLKYTILLPPAFAYQFVFICEKK